MQVQERGLDGATALGISSIGMGPEAGKVPERPRLPRGSPLQEEGRRIQGKGVGEEGRTEPRPEEYHGGETRGGVSQEREESAHKGGWAEQHRQTGLG